MKFPIGIILYHVNGCPLIHKTTMGEARLGENRTFASIFQFNTLNDNGF